MDFRKKLDVILETGTKKDNPTPPYHFSWCQEVNCGLGFTQFSFIRSLSEWHESS